MPTNTLQCNNLLTYGLLIVLCLMMFQVNCHALLHVYIYLSIAVSAFTGMYMAPCYYYPNRAGGMGRPSFVVAVELKAGEKTPDHWVKRGTALLMSLDY